MTKIINLYGGPGSGKSTTAAGVFYHLKQAGINSEYVQEFAKDLTWEERFTALQCQPYILGKQYYRLNRLLGKVDIIVTDSPVLLSMYYNNLALPELDVLALALHNKFDNINYFLKRIKPFMQAGRNQTKDEAVLADGGIKSLLDFNHIPYTEVVADDHAAKFIACEIKEALENARKS